jgi:hypothetical protein
LFSSLLNTDLNWCISMYAFPLLSVKKTNKWTNYKHFQKECKRQVRKAEWNYINDIIMERLQNNNSKPFWKYVESRKQDNIGVSPLMTLMLVTPVCSSLVHVCLPF